MRWIYIFLSLILFIQSGVACIVERPENNRSHYSLIKNATAIVLVSIEPYNKDVCQFKTLDILKAPTKNKVTLPKCLPSPKKHWAPSHYSEYFWQKQAGRLGTMGNCEVMAPTFMIGRQYLIFTGIKPDSKQYELIEKNDAWLQYVKKNLK